MKHWLSPVTISKSLFLACVLHNFFAPNTHWSKAILLTQKLMNSFAINSIYSQAVDKCHSSLKALSAADGKDQYHREQLLALLTSKLLLTMSWKGTQVRKRASQLYMHEPVRLWVNSWSFGDLRQ